MRRVTLADVARAAGVAKATASRALSADQQEVGAATRARIQEIAAEMGYQPSRVARALRTGRFRLIVLAVSPAAQDWAQVLSGAMVEAERHGYQVLVRPVAADGSVPSPDLDESPIDGTILVGPARVAPSGADSRPVVVVDEDLVDSEASVVRTANWSAGHQIGRHLIQQGRTSALVMLPPGGAGGARARAAGFQSAFAEAGLALSPDRVLEVGASDDPGVRLHAAIDQGLSFDALFGCADDITLSALGTLRRAGRVVPQDVMVACFGDERLVRMAEPSLVVVPRPARELGARAVQLLVRAIEGAAEPSEAHELPVRLHPGATRGDHLPQSVR